VGFPFKELGAKDENGAWHFNEAPLESENWSFAKEEEESRLLFLRRLEAERGIIKRGVRLEAWGVSLEPRKKRRTGETETRGREFKAESGEGRREAWGKQKTDHESPKKRKHENGRDKLKGGRMKGEGARLATPHDKTRFKNSTELKDSSL
jgi:hypothetical protein